MKQVPLVSVIITTRTEEDNIQACLESIKKQTYKNIEIILVDNNSGDNTVQIARGYTKNIFTKGPERSVQRNFGASKSNGTYMFFIDADMFLTPDVVRECVDICSDGHCIAVVIPEESIGRGYWAGCKALERKCYQEVPWMEAARFFYKKNFEEIGKYNTSLTGPEDFDISQRTQDVYGIDSIARSKATILHDEGHLQLSDLLRKKMYYGRWMKSYWSIRSNQKYMKSNLSFLRAGSKP